MHDNAHTAEINCLSLCPTHVVPVNCYCVLTLSAVNLI